MVLDTVAGDSAGSRAGKNMQQLARDSAGGGGGRGVPKLVGDTTRRIRPDVIEDLRRQITRNSVESIVGALDALMTRPDSTPTLATIHCPVQIVVGDEDAITPPALSEQMHRDIAGSELAVIQGAGHMSNMGQPQLFNDVLARFLDHRV